MIDKTLEDIYGRLKKQVENYRKYARLETWAKRLSFVSFLGVVLASMLIGFLRFPLGSENSLENILGVMYSGLVFAYASLFVVFSVGYLLQRKSRVYCPEADDLILYETCSAIEHLGDYRKSRPSSVKEEHRKGAVHDVRQLLSVLNKEWTVGDHRLAKETFGEVISSISDNLTNRVIPNLEEGNKETLEKVEHSLYQLAQYLMRPSIEALRNVNKTITESLQEIELAKPSFIKRFSSFFTVHSLLKNVIVLGLIFSAGFIPALCGFQYGGSSIDTALLVFAGIFGPSMAVYLAYVMKKTVAG